jgi:hypothetical protein
VWVRGGQLHKDAAAHPEQNSQAVAWSHAVRGTKRLCNHDAIFARENNSNRRGEKERDHIRACRSYTLSRDVALDVEKTRA